MGPAGSFERRPPEPTIENTSASSASAIATKAMSVSVLSDRVMAASRRRGIVGR